MSMKLELPLSFDDVTISMIQRHGDRELDPVEKVELYTGMTHEDVKKMPYQLIQEGANHIDQVLSTPTKRHQSTLEIEGELFGFIPDWTKFTTGEYIDAEEYSKDTIKNAPHLMAVMFRPIKRQFKDSYTIEEYKGASEHVDKFRNVSASYFYGMLLFFSTTRNESLRTSLQSLVAVVRENQTKQILTKDGHGITSLSNWRVKTLQKLKRLLNYR